MISKLRLMRWSDQEIREWTAILNRCGSREASVNERSLDTGLPALPGIPDLVERARAIYHHRKASRRAFGDDAALFQEPAWDILLELYIYGTEGPGLACTSVAYAAEVPISTTLRWIRSLKKRGLVACVIDSGDARIRRVRLTLKAEQAMAEYLANL